MRKRGIEKLEKHIEDNEEKLNQRVLIKYPMVGKETITYELYR